MSKPKVYGFCTNGCKWETVHKSDVPYKMKFLTQAEYDALEANGRLELDTMYEITDDKTLEELENRLDALGFKEGTFEIASGSATTNSIKKQGKYVIASLHLGRINEGATATIPSEFCPKEDVVVSAMLFPSGGVYMGMLGEIITIKTDGTIVVNNPSYYLTLEFHNVGWEIA